MIDILTPLGIGLLLIGLFSRLPLNRLSCISWCRNFVIFGLIVLALIPVSGFSLFNFLYGIANFFSIPTVFLLALFALRANGLPQAALSQHEKLLLASSTFLIGLVLYPSAIGFMSFDLYAIGYGYPFGLLFAVLILLAFQQGFQGLGLLYLLIWLAWLFEMNHSPNGFDYLMDFWLFGWSAIYILNWLIRGRIAWRKKSA